MAAIERASSSTVVCSDDGFGNTPLTAAISAYAFLHEHSEKLTEAAHRVALNALRDNNIELLRLPNKPVGLTRGGDAGLPVNTPLMLAVKANDVALMELLLPYYESEHLLHQSPLGNNILHVAVGHGCFHLAHLILKRANEVECVGDMMEQENKKGHHVKVLAEWLVPKENRVHRDRVFKLVDVDYSETYMGEESRKATIGFAHDLKYHKLWDLLQKNFSIAQALGADIDTLSSKLGLEEDFWGMQLIKRKMQ